MWLAVAGIAANVIGAAFGLSGASKAAKAADRAGKREAKLEGLVTDERLRQIDREEMLMREDTIARTAGSGVLVGSQSSLEVLADQASEFRKEYRITREAGATRSRAALEGGRATAQQYKYQGYSSAVGGIANAFSIANARWGKG